MKISIPNNDTELIVDRWEKISPIYFEDVDAKKVKCNNDILLKNTGLKIVIDGENKCYLAGEIKEKGQHTITFHVDGNTIEMKFTAVQHPLFKKFNYILLLFIPFAIMNFGFLLLDSCDSLKAIYDEIYSNYPAVSVFLDTALIVINLEIITCFWELPPLFSSQERIKRVITLIGKILLTIVLGLPVVITSSSKYLNEKYIIDKTSIYLSIAVLIFTIIMIKLKVSLFRE